MVIKNKKIFVFLLSLSLLIVLPVNAFSISPLKFTTSLDVGDSQDFVVTVSNDSNTKKEYQPMVVGLQQDVQGRPIFKPNSDVAEDWVKFNNEKIYLNSSGKKDLIFTILIPKNTPPGAHYLGIGAQENNDQNIGNRLMAVVVLQVAGTANESLVLEKFEVQKKYFFNKNIAYSVFLKNNGNVDLLLKAQIQIYNFRNKVKNSSAINLGNNLFAQSVRVADFNTTVGNEIFWPGKYNLALIVNYGLTNQQIVGTVGFYYLPVWFLFLIVLSIFLIILLVVYKKKKHEKMV